MNPVLEDALRGAGVFELVMGAVRRVLTPGIAHGVCECPHSVLIQHSRAPHGPGCSAWVAARVMGIEKALIDRDWHEADLAEVRRVAAWQMVGRVRAGSRYVLQNVEDGLAADIGRFSAKRMVDQLRAVQEPLEAAEAAAMQAAEIRFRYAPTLYGRSEAALQMMEVGLLLPNELNRFLERDDGATEAAGVQGGRKPAGDRANAAADSRDVGGEHGEGGSGVP